MATYKDGFRLECLDSEAQDTKKTVVLFSSCQEQ